LPNQLVDSRFSRPNRQKKETPLHPVKNTPQGRLIVRVGAGLGNRLNGLLSALVVADIFNVPLEIVWPPDHSDCFGSFDALFERDGLEGVPIHTDIDGPWQDARETKTAALRAALAAGETVKLYACTVFAYDATDGWRFFDAMRSRLRAMRPVADVRAILDTIPPARVGMHIRFTDHLPCIAVTPRWCYRSTVALLNRHLGDEPVFLCSDTPAFSAELRDALGGRAVMPPPLPVSRDRTRNTLDDTRAALVDLWLLAQCRLILCSPISSFAATAQLIGGGLAQPLAWQADPKRYRQTLIAWAIWHRVDYDFVRGAWVRKKTKRGERWIAGPVSAVTVPIARIFASSLYQDHPPAFLRRKFERRLESFLLGSACKTALTPSTTSPSVCAT
jgi:hypothetical protein